MKRKIYIAGPISGYAENNAKSFFEAELKLTFEGWEVLNPLRGIPDEGRGELEGCDYLDYLVRGLMLLRNADAVYFLKDWEKSTGAKIERLYAEKEGKELFYE